jgi:hypothetical protein
MGRTLAADTHGMLLGVWLSHVDVGNSQLVRLADILSAGRLVAAMSDKLPAELLRMHEAVAFLRGHTSLGEDALADVKRSITKTENGWATLKMIQGVCINE